MDDEVKRVQALFAGMGALEKWVITSRFVERLLELDTVDHYAIGKVEGRTKVIREMALHLLTRRFGELPEALVQRIEATDAAWCIRLFDLAIEVNSLTELTLQYMVRY